MEITLTSLRTVAVKAQAIVAQKALGFRIDRKLSELSALCLDRIKYEYKSEFTKGSEEEVKFWSIEVDDFEFDPIEVAVSDDLDKQFTESNIDIINGDMRYSINPYSAFFSLVADGFIIITE